MEFQVDDQDHSADWLRRGAVAAAVTTRGAPVQGCDSIALGALAYLPAAAPAFAARWFPDGPTAEALARAPALVFDEKDRLQQRWAEAVAGRRIALPAHRLPSSEGFVTAAELGLGWGMMPRLQIAGALAAGRLVALAPEGMATPLYWQVSRLSAPGLAPLTARVRRAAKERLDP